MADYSQSPNGGYTSHVHPEYVTTAGAGSLTKLTNLAGAAVSLALVVGIGVWGYKLLVRDVSGIPLVRAVAGEMRVRPEVPGGQLAKHQGLSVNTVAAIGEADKPADQVRLAPEQIYLTDEDQPMSAFDNASDEGLSIDDNTPVDVAGALESGSMEDLVAELTNGVAPLEDFDSETVPVLASASAADVAQLLSGDGMRASLRPTIRPRRARAVASAVVAPVAAVSTTEIDATSLPAGTRLVQLGAFDSPEIARAQWDKLNARFGPYLEGKNRIVQEARSGGRTFYRLRAQGFEDISDARRFCSAFVAESVDCIPVVTR